MTYKLKQGVILFLVSFSLIVLTMVSLMFGMNTGNMQVCFPALGAMTSVLAVLLNVVIWMAG